MVADLSVITARPTAEEEANAQHALYGVLPATTPTSVALWLNMVQPIIMQAWAEGKLPMMVGGTGMYTSALMHGISKIPPIPETLRQDLRQRYPDAADGRLHAALAARDPVMAEKLKPGDTQRLLRALEVVEATGQSLDTWHKLGNAKIFPEAEFTSFYLDKPRETVYARINQRFDLMMENGALEEVKALLTQQLPPDTPILRAHGVPELSGYVRGERTLNDAVLKAKQHTRNYAKRQMTWIRHQLPDAIPIQSAEEIFTQL